MYAKLLDSDPAGWDAIKERVQISLKKYLNKIADIIWCLMVGRSITGVNLPISIHKVTELVIA